MEFKHEKKEHEREHEREAQEREAKEKEIKEREAKEAKEKKEAKTSSPDKNNIVPAKPKEPEYDVIRVPGMPPGVEYRTGKHTETQVATRLMPTDVEPPVEQRPVVQPGLDTPELKAEREREEREAEHAKKTGTSGSRTGTGTY